MSLNNKDEVFRTNNKQVLTASSSQIRSCRAERLLAKNPYNQFPEVPDISSDIIKFKSISHIVFYQLFLGSFFRNHNDLHITMRFNQGFCLTFFRMLEEEAG